MGAQSIQGFCRSYLAVRERKRRQRVVSLALEAGLRTLGKAVDKLEAKASPFKAGDQVTALSTAATWPGLTFCIRLENISNQSQDTKKTMKRIVGPSISMYCNPGTGFSLFCYVTR